MRIDAQRHAGRRGALGVRLSVDNFAMVLAKPLPVGTTVSTKSYTAIQGERRRGLSVSAAVTISGHAEPQHQHRPRTRRHGAEPPDRLRRQRCPQSRPRWRSAAGLKVLTDVGTIRLEIRSSRSSPSRSGST